jgi:hypothetical protein
MVEDVALSHKMDYVSIFLENRNLKGHLNRFIGAILVNGEI